MKTYGPYFRDDDKRGVVIHIDEHGKRTTQSYPRFLFEKSIGRRLLDNETVDHIDGDVTNNVLENFQLLSREDNARKSIKPAELLRFICPECGAEFLKEARTYRSNNVRRRSKGPYCSRHCSGTANKKRRPL